jgi:uncharacterized membrane protein YhaH (DUF805 family)
LSGYGFSLWAVSFLLGIVLYLAIMFIQSPEAADRVFDSPEFDTVLSLLALPLVVAHTWGLFAVLIKRLHDLDMRGWWSLLLFIPLFNLLNIGDSRFNSRQPGSQPLWPATAGTMAMTRVTTISYSAVTIIVRLGILATRFNEQTSLYWGPPQRLASFSPERP